MPISLILSEILDLNILDQKSLRKSLTKTLRTASEGSWCLGSDLVKNVKGLNTSRQRPTTSKLSVQILSFEKCNTCLKKKSHQYSGYGLIQNEKQLYLYENAKPVNGIECVPLNSCMTFGKLHILFELQCPYW